MTLCLITALIIKPGNQLIQPDDCTCPGQNQVYECRVVGKGVTIWKGTAFECAGADNEIVLLHVQNTTTQLECNNGAILGRIIRSDNNTYVSQLTVAVSHELAGRSITCIHDSISSEATNIGTSLLTVTTGT